MVVWMRRGDGVLPRLLAAKFAVLQMMPRRLRAVELRLQTLQLLLLACCCDRLGTLSGGDKQVYVLPCHRARSIVVSAERVVVRSTEA